VTKEQNMLLTWAQ